MNYRSKVLDVAMRKIYEAPLKDRARLDWIGKIDSHDYYWRVNRLMMLCYFLHIRPRIKEVVNNYYTFFLTVDEITKIVVPDEEDYFTEVSHIGYNSYFYTPDLQKLVSEQVQKEIDLIESHTLEIKFE